MPKYFDIHSHLNSAAFDLDRQEVINKMKELEVSTITVGMEQATSKVAVEMAESLGDGFYATVGLHPTHTASSYHNQLENINIQTSLHGEQFEFNFYKKLAESSKVVAIGECGLDYFRLEQKSIQKQKEVFEAQIELANITQKPLMLHIRPSLKSQDAYLDSLEILKANSKVKGNAHFFAGNYETAKKYFDIGFTISFTGVLTFTNDYDEVVKNSPLNMIMSETDSPYVAPAPYRGKRNEPSFVIEVVKAIARIKNEPLEKVQTALVQNALMFFNIKVDN